MKVTKLKGTRPRLKGPPLTWHEVLRFRSGYPQSTVYRKFLDFRAERAIPYRCDMPGCPNPDPTTWNGKKLRLVLDHVRGAREDNKPKNLRFLCPNCNSQQDTFAGGNRGRVRYHTGGYDVRRAGTQSRDYYLDATDLVELINGGR
jgi:hypothetical protein